MCPAWLSLRGEVGREDLGSPEPIARERRRDLHRHRLDPGGRQLQESEVLRVSRDEPIDLSRKPDEGERSRETPRFPSRGLVRKGRWGRRSCGGGARCGVGEVLTAGWGSNEREGLPGAETALRTPRNAESGRERFTGWAGERRGRLTAGPVRVRATRTRSRPTAWPSHEKASRCSCRQLGQRIRAKPRSKRPRRRRPRPSWPRRPPR